MNTRGACPCWMEESDWQQAAAAGWREEQRKCRPAPAGSPWRRSLPIPGAPAAGGER